MVIDATNDDEAITIGVHRSEPDGFRLILVASTTYAYIALMSDHPQRRFPPPWDVEDNGACFIVRDANGQALSALGVQKVGDHHERTNRIPIHFSSKAALACCNGRSYSIAGKHAANVGRSRSD